MCNSKSSYSSQKYLLQSNQRREKSQGLVIKRTTKEGVVSHAQITVAISQAAPTSKRNHVDRPRTL